MTCKVGIENLFMRFENNKSRVSSFVRFIQNSSFLETSEYVGGVGGLGLGSLLGSVGLGKFVKYGCIRTSYAEGLACVNFDNRLHYNVRRNDDSSWHVMKNRLN